MAETSAVVLDTNVVLDLWLFNDPRTSALRQALLQGQLLWIATAHMREELRRVLDYDHLVSRLACYQMTALQVLELFERHAQFVPVPDKAPWRCKDPDDQVFIDLAVAHQCPLISKDKAVLALRKALARAQVLVSREWVPGHPPCIPEVPLVPIADIAMTKLTQAR
jgi:putative PIN family toxin of toxin-antitoxin system